MVQSGDESASQSGDKSPQSKSQPSELVWHATYREAMDAADKEGRMMLILFCGPENAPSASGSRPKR